ncbi:MAG: tetratricopeptide repeat protein [Pseudomonadota bacterium]
MAPKKMLVKPSNADFWMVAAGLIVTAINGAIAFYGWSSAKSIGEYEATAQSKLKSIQLVAERGYVLYAKAAEREFIDLVASSPGIEFTGVAANSAKESVREYKRTLDILEKEIAAENLQPTQHLMEGYLNIVDGDCKSAIRNLEMYSKDISIKYLLLSTAHMRCGNINKSIELNNKVRDLPVTKPSDRIKAKALNNNGNAMVKMGQLDDAITYYLDALSADPSLYTVRYNLSAAYSKQMNQQEALRWLCKYEASSDANVINEVESDPDNEFVELIKYLGSNWKTKLAKQLIDCDK